MRAVQRFIMRVPRGPSLKSLNFFPFSKPYSSENSGGSNSETDWGATFGSRSADSDKFGWEAGSSSWSTGLTAEHFDGETVGKPISLSPAQDSVHREYRIGVSRSDGAGFGQTQWTDEELVNINALNEANRKAKAFEDGWEGRMRETSALMKQIREPGARGAYLKDSEKAEMYRKHKENPEEYTVERLAKEYRIMRQRVHAILWLKEEEEEQRKLGRELDDSVELLLDSFPEFFNSHDREFHVASLPYKPKFKVMPEGWDGTTRDLDEVHYEISKKEDEMLYQEFVQKLEFNKKKFKKQVACHKYSRRRPSEGWNFTVEKLGPRGKRGDGGGWKFVSKADGSSRPLNEFEKMFLKRETPRRRKKILP